MAFCLSAELSYVKIIMSASSGDSSGEKSGPSTSKKIKKKHYRQKFREEWLSDQNFKTWLQRDAKDPYRAICVLCDSKMLADRVAIKRHSEGNKHLKKSVASSSPSQPSVAKVFEKKTFKSDEEKCKTAEIKLAAFMTEHKISHRVMDHLTDLLPTIFPESNTAKSLKMKRTKLQAVINNVLGVTEKQELCADLKNQKFSVMIDESTDIGSVKTMCVVVRYYCPVKNQIISRFWDLIQIHGEDKAVASATAEYLFEAVLKSFVDNSIPIENLIGFGSDGCNTMMGCHNSVSSRFRAKCPGIIVLKCVCHSLHLCASDACKQLPAECEKLTRDVYNYFATSSKRQSQFKEFQEFTETNVHKILKPAQTRWLSLTSVVERLLEQWDALTLFFNGRWLEDNECAEIHKQLNDPVIKAFFFFLNWMLPKFTQANTLFQSESPKITEMHTKMNDLYYELLSTYMKKTYIDAETDLDKIDPTDERYFKGLDEIYLGLGVQKQLSTNEIPFERKREMKNRCRNFLVKACVGIRKRYALSDPVLTAISKLDPNSCFDDSSREESLQNLLILLPRLAPTSITDQQQLDDQWRKLPKLKRDFELDTSQRPDEFWHNVSKIIVVKVFFIFVILGFKPNTYLF